MKEKETLFEKTQNGDFSAMKILVESYFNLVDEYVEHYKKKHDNFDPIDLTRYIKSMLFRRMQICCSIFSYEKDVKKLIQREAIKYMRNLNIQNKKEEFNFIDLNVDERILKVLNDLLEPDVYYVFYQMISGVDIKSIANKLDVSLIEIRKRYIYALEMLDLYLDKDNKKLKRRLYTINWREGNKSKRVKVVPYSIDSIIVYFYLKDELTEEERKLYYYQVFSKYQYYQSELETFLGINENIESISASLNQKINICVNREDYQEFYQEMVSNYGPYLYNLVKSENVKKFDFASISQVVNLLTFEDIKKFLSDDFGYITPSEKKLLYKYYKPREMNADLADAERDINLNLFGYKQKRNEIMPKKFYQTYLDHIGEFDKTQQLFLECYYFGIRDKKDFLEMNADSRLYYRYYYLVDRLERLYYNVYNFLDNDFNKSKWLKIRDKYQEKQGAERVKLLDLFYGVNGEPMSIQEIHKKYYPHLTYVRIHDLISDARDAAINTYTNKKYKIDVNKKDYLPYLNGKYEYTDEAFKILTMFLRDGANYDEIAKEMGLSKTRISNIITENIRKMDHYRLGIFKLREIDSKLLEDVFRYFPDSFSDFDKEIYRLRFVYGNNNDAVAMILNISKSEVNKKIANLYKKIDKYMIRNVSLTITDIRKELRRHFTDTVINENSCKVLSLYYGIKNKYNKTGETYAPIEIMKMLGISSNTYYRNLCLGQDQIKLRKIGLEIPPFYVFPRSDLPEILQDKHLPISDKERFIINSLFALSGHKYMSCDELASYYGENNTSIRRRYYRAMVNIKKYQKGEIEEQINYEEDIVPLLKYFSRSDRIFIHDYFKENVSYTNLAKKYGMTPDMILRVLNRIKITIFELTHNTNNNLFDFDYYYEVINDPKLPFYGNLELAKQIFELYFGMNEMRRLSVPEIIERLNLDTKETAVHNAIYSIMLSVCKFREGIRKQNEFTLEEIVDYFNRHKDEIDLTHRIYYDRYFKKVKNIRDVNGRVTKIPLTITYDLLKERESNLFRLENASSEEINSILANEDYILDSKTKHILMERVNPHGELDGREINHVYRIINSLMERNLLFIDKGKSYRLQIKEQ